MTLTVPARFNGPRDSANGGYVAGLLAGQLPVGAREAVEVRLTAPPPLDRELAVDVADGDAVLRDGERVLGTARRAGLELEVPPPVTLAEAAAAAARSPMRAELHPFPTCFGCGPLREAGDALRHICGPVAGRDVFACPMTTAPELPHDAEGRLLAEVLWAALDCPSASATVPVGGPAHVLATFTVAIDRPVGVGEPHVVMAWPLGHVGRKRLAGSALVDAAGAVCARAQALWIALRG